MISPFALAIKGLEEVKLQAPVELESGGLIVIAEI